VASAGKRLAIGAAVVLGTAACSNSGSSGGGPLADPGPSMGEALTIDLNRVGTYGAETIENHGGATAVLDRISYVGLSPGLRVFKTLAMHVRTQPGATRLATGMIRQFPPPHKGATLRPLAGFRVRPYRSWRDTVELLIGFRGVQKGVHSFRAFRLYYHVGGKHYVATYHDFLTVCVPYSFPLSRCNPPKRG